MKTLRFHMKIVRYHMKTRCYHMKRVRFHMIMMPQNWQPFNEPFPRIGYKMYCANPLIAFFLRLPAIAYLASKCVSYGFFQ